MSPSTSPLSRRIAWGSYGPTICELRHVASASVPETTYLVVSLKNGAPGSSSTVRVDHAGSNISYVARPSRMPSARAVISPSRSPILGSKPNSNVHDGASITPSRLMNSWTWIAPISLPPGCRGLWIAAEALDVPHGTRVGRSSPHPHYWHLRIG